MGLTLDVECQRPFLLHQNTDCLLGELSGGVGLKFDPTQAPPPC